MTIFHERESVAEAIFVHAEEARFDDRLRGVKALARLTSVTCGWDNALADAYQQKLISLLVKGSSDEALIDRAMFDCPRQDRKDLVPMARALFLQAAAAFSNELS